jgi:membrane protein implicated in regulation of membrane protease activity
VRGQTLVGRIGTVVHAVRGGSRPGEVRVVVAGIAHYYIAYAARAIPAGSEVLVINHRGARQVDVEPWPSLAAGAASDTEGSP